MAQPLWYIRADGSVKGPFPTPQINEMLRTGELRPGQEVSLDKELWEPVESSGHFGGRRGHAGGKSENDEGWEMEREKARQRWLEGVEPGQENVMSSLERAELDALRQDEDTTRELVHAEASRRPSLLIGIFALLAIAAVGVAVWYGQSEKSIQASLEKVSSCSAPAAEGVVWLACDHSRAQLKGAVLRTGKLANGKFDGAVLSGADMSYADLQRASLRGADLNQSILLGASLNGADLTGADLAGADLRYASLSGAILEGARLTGARLGKATWSDGRLCAEDSVETCR